MIRYGIDSDYKRAREIWEECFKDSQEEVDFYFTKLYDKNKFLVLEESGSIRASLHENPYKLNINGKIFPSNYIVGVAVSPQYRGRGYMGKLMEESLKKSYEKGLPLVFLSPINPEIYRGYGFEYITKLNKLSLETKEICFDKIDREFEIVKFEIESSLYSDLISVYDFVMKNRSLYVERDENYYKNWVAEIISDGGDIYMLYSKGIVRGYVALYRGEILTVRELFAKGKREYESLLSFIKTFREYYPKLEIKTPEGERIEYYFKNQKRVYKSENQFIMGRVLKPKKILETLGIKGITFKISIVDDIISDNNRVFSLNESGQVNIVDTDWDLRVKIGDFSLLSLGVLSLEELIFLERVEIKNTQVVTQLIEKNIFKLKLNYIQDYQ